MKTINIKQKAECADHLLDVISSFNGNNYLLMVCGGRTPYDLYSQLACNFKFPFPKDVALTDDRLLNNNPSGKSTETMIKSTGLLGRIYWEKSQFHPVINPEIVDPVQMAAFYEKELAALFDQYKENVVAVMGMAENGHIAGMQPYCSAVTADQLVVAYPVEDSGAINITITQKCILDHIPNILLLLNTEEKIGVFTRTMEYESDIEKWPSIVFKGVPNMRILCYNEKL